MRNIFIISCVLVLLLLPACGRRQTEEPPVIEYPAVCEAAIEAPEVQEVPEPEQEPVAEPEPRLLTDIFSSGRTRGEYLEDIDYLYEILKANFALFQPLYRNRGVCLHQLFANTRHRVETNRTDLPLSRILYREIFSHVNWFGHMAMFESADPVRLRLASFSGRGCEEYGNPFAPFIEVIDNPATRAFYRLTDADFEPRGAQQQAFLQHNPGNIETRIIEEDRIAYVRIRTMSGSNMEGDYPILIEFFEKVAEFDHLIIDIRGNSGGSSAFFPQLVMAPNINETLYYNYYSFIMAGEHNLRFLEARRMTGYFSPVNPGLFASLPYFHPSDIEVIDYYRRRAGQVNPSRDGAIFGGKIWLLIDGANFSASGTAASIAKETGCATLVGTPTSSSGPGIDPTIVALPNTGIIVQYQTLYSTCFLGRNGYEYGTLPHIPNFEGMDALATVLAVIEQMD